LQQPETWVKAAVALNPNTPENVLRELATIEDFDIAFALASNPNLPTDLQLQLAKHPERTIRHHIADQHISTAIWEIVASHPGPTDIRGPLEDWLKQALNPETPNKVLSTYFWPSNKEYSKDEVLSTSVMHALAVHPNFPTERLAEFRYYLPWIESKNRVLQLMVLEGRKLPKARPTEDWRISTGNIGKLPAYIANHLAQHGDFNQKKNSLYHLKINRSNIIPLVFTQDVPTLKKLAERIDMPRFFYELLWEHGIESVQKILVKNPESTLRRADFTQEPTTTTAQPKPTSSTRTLRNGAIKIKGDKKQRISLAENTASMDEIRALMLDKAEEVRAVVAFRPEVFNWPECWDVLANDSSRKVRANLAVNSKASFEVIEQLANDIEPEVVQSAIYGLLRFPAETTKDIEAKLLRRDREITSHLAMHARDQQILQTLSMLHPDDTIRNENFIPSKEFLLIHGEKYCRFTGKSIEEVLNSEGYSRANSPSQHLIAIIFAVLLKLPESQFKKHVQQHQEMSQEKVNFFKILPPFYQRNQEN
jgi:hypothetical protein